MHDVIAENFQLFVACQENGIHFGDCVEKSNVQLQIPAWDSWYGAFLCVVFNNFLNVHVPMQCTIYLYYSDPFNFDVKIDNFSNTINNFFSELSGILHQCHVLASEMVHFIQQVQYYINFEVTWNTE